MSKTLHPRPPRNNVAYGMITAGTGKAQVFGDKRNKRSKDHRRKREWLSECEGYTLTEVLGVLFALACGGLLFALACVVVHFICKWW